jgi:hypothetical protein
VRNASEALRLLPVTPELSVLPSGPSSLQLLVTDFLASCRARGLSSRTVESGYGYPLRSVFLPWCTEQAITEVGQLNQPSSTASPPGSSTGGGRSGRPLSKYSVHAYARAVVDNVLAN